MSLVEIKKEKIKLAPRLDIKPSEVLREAEGKIEQCTGALCRPTLRGGEAYCAIGVLAFEKGARHDDKIMKDFSGIPYHMMYLNGKSLTMGGVIELYGIKDMNIASDIFTINDHDGTFAEIASMLEAKGY